MLSATKHLETERDRPFASLRVTCGEGQVGSSSDCQAHHCHAECNEASRPREIDPSLLSG
jgi:hypothetical protein